MDKEKVGIVACSNAQSEKQKGEIDRLCQVLDDLHQKPLLSPCLFAKQEPFSGTGQERFCHMQELFQIETEFVQGDSMSGVLVGGNIRCFLKLAGTRFFPPLEGKLLLLEALGGEVPQMVTYLSQLKQLGAFEKVNGVLLGTFSMMEAKGAVPDILELVRWYAGTELPIARTREIGHGMDAKAVRIGAFYSL